VPSARARGLHGCHFFASSQRNGERKDAKGFNTLWEPAKFVCWAVFWWLPKGVVASAIFAQQNPKILLLLQAGEYVSLHTSAALSARQILIARAFALK
jgi:hypothetical protein